MYHPRVAGEPDLSVVVPVYEAAPFLRDRIAHLVAALERVELPWEIVLVDDGSADGTREVIDALAREDSRIAAVSLPVNRGKYGALAAGMARTRGRACVFMDADIPYALDVLAPMARLVLDQGFHVVVGDRTLPGSSYAEHIGPVRRVATGAFTLTVRLLVTGGLHDTQCGLKAFRGDVARTLFPLLRETGFAGDVELLYVALKYNLAIRRVPVRLEHQGPSSVSPVRHGAAMFRSLLPLRSRWTRGVYRSEALERIARESYGLPGGIS